METPHAYWGLGTIPGAKDTALSTELSPLLPVMTLRVHSNNYRPALPWPILFHLEGHSTSQPAPHGPYGN